ncbi:hypothetical protein [Polaribacter sp.]|uniref:hypothetical protein n=1 Tax=Polaribacter sp. TaxID=1920175 RepID=UPI003F69711C
MKNKKITKEIKKYLREEIETRIDIMVEDIWDDYTTEINFEEKFGTKITKYLDSEYFNNILNKLYDVVVIDKNKLDNTPLIFRCKRG